MRLIGDALFMSFARIMVLVLAACINILTARALGPQGRGTFALPSIDSSIGATFCLGLSSAIAYFLLNKKAGRSAVGIALIAALAFAAAGSAVTVAIAAWNGQLWAAVPALIYLPFYAVLSIVSGYWIGRDRVRIWSVVLLATSGTTLALMLGGFELFGRTPPVAIGAWVAGTSLVALVAGAATLWHARSLHGEPSDPKAFAVYAGKAGALNVMTILNYRVDVFIVAALAPLSVLGLYTVAVAGAESALALTHTVSMVTAPRVGSLSREQAGAFTARCARNSLFVAAVMATLASLAAPWVVKLLFGSAYVALVPALRILLVGVVILSIVGVISNYFMLNLGEVRIPLVAAGVSACVCAAVCFAAIPSLGMSGAALATAVAYSVGGTIMVVAFCRETRLPPSRVLLLDGEDLVFYRGLATRFRFRGA